MILAIGRSVHEALSAGGRLSRDGIDATVVNCRFVKPLDVELIVDLVKKIPYVITVEENVLQGGFGSAVLECLQDNGITHFKMKRIGIKDTFVEHGPQRMLRSLHHIDADAIYAAAAELLHGNK